MRYVVQIIGVLVVAAAAAAAQENIGAVKPQDLSFRNEVQRAIEKGLEFLKTSQNSNGWWCTPDHPSVTALALSAFMGDPQNRHHSRPSTKKAYEYVLGCAKPDGSIYVTNLANYNTAISLMALVAAREVKYETVARKARAYLVNSQVDLGG